MSVRLVVRTAIAAGALVGLVACSDAGPPPYGFAALPEQRFALEATGEIAVDGEPVRVERYVEFTIRAQPLDAGGAELALYLERFYESVNGSEGASEVGISQEGILVRGGEQGDLRLGPEDATPTADSVRDLLSRPIATAILGGDGRAQGQTWRSYDPLLTDVAPLEWFVFALPLLEGDGVARWSGSREVPKVGRYRLGIQLPVTYERVAGEGGGPGRIHAAGFARRDDLALAEDFRGDLELDYEGWIELTDETRLAQLSSTLVLDFEATNGSAVRSTERVRIRSRDAAVNPDPAAPDQRGS